MSRRDPRGLEIDLYAFGRNSTRPAEVVALSEFHRRLTAGDYAVETARGRRLSEAESRARDAHIAAPGNPSALGAYRDARRERSVHKSLAFPAVTCAGTFEHRWSPQRLARNIERGDAPANVLGQLTWTGLVPLDFDHLEVPPPTLIERLRADPAIALAYISPSGVGVKAFVAVDPAPSTHDEHRAACEAMFAVYEAATIDAKGGKDAERLSFAAHDPQAYLAEAVVPRRWTMPEPPAPRRVSPRPAPPGPIGRGYVRCAIDGELRELHATPDGNRHHRATAAAMRIAGFVLAEELDESAAYAEWRAAFDEVKPDQVAGEGDAIWRHAMANAAPAVPPPPQVPTAPPRRFYNPLPAFVDADDLYGSNIVELASAVERPARPRWRGIDASRGLVRKARTQPAVIEE